MTALIRKVSRARVAARTVYSMSFDPTTVTATSHRATVVGTVIAWPSGSNPADYPKWLE